MTLWKKAASARSGGGLELTYDSVVIITSSPASFPANTEAGDLVICMCGYSGNSTVYPSGFTGIGKSTGTVEADNTMYSTITSSYRIAQSGDAGSTIYGSGNMLVFLVKASTPISTVTVQDYTSQFTTSTVINAGSTSKACVTVAGLRGYSTSPYYTATYSDVSADRYYTNGNLKAFNPGTGADNTYTIVSGNNGDGRHAFYLEVE